MTSTAPVVTVSPRDYDAVLFDLDGVLTKTASVHAAAWKRLFDGFLEQRAADFGAPFVAFDIDADYRRYVDGRPRYDGVAAFLEARGIELPWGAREDSPGTKTVHALGHLKDQYFMQHLEQHGVEVYKASIALVRTLRTQEIKTAVVSSSRNCAAVLGAAGISPLFDARVDGTDITRLGLMARLGLSAAETARWDDISRRMFVPFHGDGIISQFEGYEELAELDWEGYRRWYGNIQRLELILEAESDGANRYKASKQADVLMLFYLFSADELGELFRRLGYPFEYETIPRNVAYYDRRSSHGSTLSRVVHAWVLARSDQPRSMAYYAEALQSNVNDIQQGTTAEGVHLGAMAGTVDLVQRVSTGIEVTGDVLRLNPRLPQELARLDMRIRYRGHSLDLRLTRDTLTVRGHEPGAAPIKLGIKNEVYEFAGGSTRVFKVGGGGP